MNNVLSWNCWGLGSIPIVNALRCVVINKQPQLVFIQEMKLHYAKMGRVRIKLKCKDMLVVDCVGEGKRR